eukprot:2504768-Pleurochrysis_carterae.AAC.2
MDAPYVPAKLCRKGAYSFVIECAEMPELDMTCPDCDGAIDVDDSCTGGNGFEEHVDLEPAGRPVAVTTLDAAQEVAVVPTESGDGAGVGGSEPKGVEDADDSAVPIDLERADAATSFPEGSRVKMCFGAGAVALLCWVLSGGHCIQAGTELPVHWAWHEGRSTLFCV